MAIYPLILLCSYAPVYHWSGSKSQGFEISLDPFELTDSHHGQRICGSIFEIFDRFADMQMAGPWIYVAREVSRLRSIAG